MHILRLCEHPCCVNANAWHCYNLVKWVFLQPAADAVWLLKCAPSSCLCLTVWLVSLHGEWWFADFRFAAEKTVRMICCGSLAATSHLMIFVALIRSAVLVNTMKGTVLGRVFCHCLCSSAYYLNKYTHAEVCLFDFD